MLSVIIFLEVEFIFQGLYTFVVGDGLRYRVDDFKLSVGFILLGFYLIQEEVYVYFVEYIGLVIYNL